LSDLPIEKKRKQRTHQQKKPRQAKAIAARSRKENGLHNLRPIMFAFFRNFNDLKTK